jgi:hypothetical protein
VLLVGGGPQDANLKAQAQRLGIADKVVFTGRVPHSEVSRYYDLIDLLAYPRHSMRLTELVTPLKPLEAMAQGRIFVASDVGGHKELIRDGETGRLFAAGQVPALVATLNDMLAHRDRWPAMRTAGRHFVEDVRNWKNSVANYKAVYGRLRRDRRHEIPIKTLVGPPAAPGGSQPAGQLGELLRGEGAVEVVQVVPTARPGPKSSRAARGVPAFPICCTCGAAAKADLHADGQLGWSWHLFAAPAIWIGSLRGTPVVVNYRGGEAEPSSTGRRRVRASMPRGDAGAAVRFPERGLRPLRHGRADRLQHHRPGAFPPGGRDPQAGGPHRGGPQPGAHLRHRHRAEGLRRRRLRRATTPVGGRHRPQAAELQAPPPASGLPTRSSSPAASTATRWPRCTGIPI